jgi:NMD protein affecting ribosome stability and mRNA decay
MVTMRQCHWCGVHFDTLDPGDHLCGECRDELNMQLRAGLADNDVLCQQCGAEIHPGRTLCRACEDERWTGEE